MRLNYFVGIEGTHSLIRKALESNAGAGPFAVFFGQEARSRRGDDLNSILAYIFNEIPTTNEASVGLTKRAGEGQLLLNLLEKSPSGTRVWFFKSSNNSITEKLHQAFLNAGWGQMRKERVTRVSEAELENTDFAEIMAAALVSLETSADRLSAGAWMDFDSSTLLGGTSASSDIKVRLYTKP